MLIVTWTLRSQAWNNIGLGVLNFLEEAFYTKFTKVDILIFILYILANVDLCGLLLSFPLFSCSYTWCWMAWLNELNIYCSLYVSLESCSLSTYLTHNLILLDRPCVPLIAMVGNGSKLLDYIEFISLDFLSSCLCWNFGLLPDVFNCNVHMAHVVFLVFASLEEIPTHFCWMLGGDGV